MWTAVQSKLNQVMVVTPGKDSLRWIDRQLFDPPWEENGNRYLARTPIWVKHTPSAAA